MSLSNKPSEDNALRFEQSGFVNSFDLFVDNRRTPRMWLGLCNGTVDHLQRVWQAFDKNGDDSI